nr:MAG TPA: hypothetical protein [Caudoviricetes sp.]
MFFIPQCDCVTQSHPQITFFVSFFDFVLYSPLERRY